MRPVLRGGGLVVEMPTTYRCLSSAVLGGGLGWIRTWLNLQVESGYDCGDPEADLRRAAVGLPRPVVGMLTAAPIADFRIGSEGCARAVATVGLRHPVVAAGGAVLGGRTTVGTVNLLAVIDVPLSDAGLANALQTAVEAKVQALAAARVRALNGEGHATGTPTDSVCIACPPGGSQPYAGVATSHGRDLAMAVYRAVHEGAMTDRGRRSDLRGRWRPKRPPGSSPDQDDRRGVR